MVMTKILKNCFFENKGNIKDSAIIYNISKEQIQQMILLLLYYLNSICLTKLKKSSHKYE